VKLTVVTDTPAVPGFRSEFGLSMLLHGGMESFLFDTGAGEALLPNLRQLGGDPEALARVVLSHGHYDHTGGLAGLAPHEVWCGRGIDTPHISRHADGALHVISMPEASLAVLNMARLRYVEDWLEFLPGIWLTGPIPRVSGEDCGGDFYRDAACTVPDTVPEEIALLTENGTLVTGCCHAGIINTLEHCRKGMPEIQVKKIVGGLHLCHADEKRLAQTATYLRRSGIPELALMHCTGEMAVEYLKNALPDCAVHTPRPGDTMEI